MNHKNIFLAAAVIVTSLFSGCVKEEDVIGPDSSLPGADEVTYDPMNSSSETIAVVWNADRAVNAGAASFTVQLVTSPTAEGDVYDTSMSQNIKIEDGMYDLTQFSNLSEGKIYYVRLRANYPGSRFSLWSFAANEDGSPARIKVGKGIVPEDEAEDVASTKVKVGYVSESTAIVSWSVTDFKNSEADKKITYQVELYKDKELKDLEVSYTIGNIWGKYAGPCFQFTGLESGKDYYLRVREAVTEGSSVPDWSALVKLTTTVSEFKEISTAPVKEGDVVLCQDFHELVWGGDQLRAAAGYSSQNRGSDTELWKASGKDADKVMGKKGFYFVNAGVEMGLFNTLGAAIPSTSLKDWGWFAEDDQIAAVCVRAGQAKIGAMNKCAWIVTPQLTNIPESATVDLSFSAAVVDDDPGQIVVELLDGATVGEKNKIIPASRVVVASLKLAGGWKEYTVTLDNVSAASRIAIGGDRQGIDGQHRFCLDDVKVTVRKFGSTTVELTVPEGLVVKDIAEKTAMVEWTPVSGAGSYIVSYKVKTASEWTEVSVTSIPYFFKELLPGTEYEVRVKAVAGDSESAYSESVTFVTKAAGGKIVSQLLHADESSIAVKWSISDFQNPDEDKADQYVLELFKDQACTDLVVKWSFPKDPGFWQWNSNAWAFLFPVTPNFKFTGLKADTEYFVRVTDMDKDIVNVNSYRTTPSKFVEMALICPSEGDVVLYEDFHDLLWGGDATIPSFGYSSNDRSKATSISPALGEDPTAGGDFYLTNFTVEMGLFSTLKSALPSTSLKDWGWYNPSKKQQVSARPGYLKFGSGGGAGWLVTPALDCLPEGVHTVTLDFDYHPYREMSWDSGAISIEVFTDYTVDAENAAGVNLVTPNEGGRKLVKSIPLTEEFKWQHHTETLDVSAGDRIVIGTDVQKNEGKHRFFLDNIQIKFVK